MPASTMAQAISSTVNAVFTEKQNPGGVKDSSILLAVDTPAASLSFTVQGSLDNSNWADLAVIPLNTNVVTTAALAPTAATLYKIPNVSQVPYIRCKATAGTGNCSFVSDTENDPSVIYAASSGTTFNGAAQLTSTSANALTVGRLGTTTPAFNVDASATTSVTGLNVVAAAAASGLALSVTSSGANESLTIDAKGSGTISLNATGTGNVILGDAINLQVGTTTGTKIGSATTQKLAFYNSTPIVQPANTVDYVTMLTNLGLRATGGTAAASFPGAISSSSATGGIGYATGAGGTVTQATSKSTGATLNKICGEIVMNGAALADGAEVSFTFTNSAIAATDVVIVNHASVGTAGAYVINVSAVAAGSCSITVGNVSGGSLSEAIKLNFAVVKAVAA